MVLRRHLINTWPYRRGPGVTMALRQASFGFQAVRCFAHDLFLEIELQFAVRRITGVGGTLVGLQNLSSAGRVEGARWIYRGVRVACSGCAASIPPPVVAYTISGRRDAVALEATANRIWNDSEWPMATTTSAAASAAYSPCPNARQTIV